MKNVDMIRAWKDEEYRLNLSQADHGAAGRLSRQECEIISRYCWAGSETESRQAVMDYANLMGGSLGVSEDALDLWIHLLGLRQKESGVETHAVRTPVFRPSLPQGRRRLNTVARIVPEVQFGTGRKR